MKIIPIPLSFGLTDTIYETKMGFKTADVNSAVLQFSSIDDPIGCVATLTLKNESENANYYSNVIEQFDVTENPFKYTLGNEIGSSGIWIGEITLKKNLITVCSQEFRFSIGESLQTSILGQLIKAKSLDEVVASIQSDVMEHLGKSDASVSEINVYVNDVVAKLLVAEGIRVSTENTRKLDETARGVAFTQWSEAVQNLIDTGVIDNRVEAIINEYQSTFSTSLFSLGQQLEQVLTNGSILGSRFALMSDSIGKAPFYDAEGGYDASVNRVGETWITTASVASGGIIRVGINASIAGNTTQQMLDRFDVDLGGANFSKWDTLTLCGGVNDSAYTVLQTRDNLEAMAIKARKAGKNVVFCTLFPSNEHTTRVRIRKINYLITQLAAKYHAPLVDFHTRFLDPVTARWIEGYYYDQLHPNLLGVNTAGKLFAEKITSYVQNATPFMAQDNLDTRVMINGTVYNPLWLIDTDANGTPDGFTKSTNPGGFTIEFGSNPTFDAIANRCKIVAVNTGSLGEMFANAAYASDKWTIGDICQFACKYRFTSGVPNTVAPRFFVRVVATGSASGYAYQQEMQGELDGVLVTEPFAVPAGTTALSVRVGMMGGVGELEFSRFTPINLTKQLMI